MNLENFVNDFAESFRVSVNDLSDNFLLSKIDWDSLGIIETIALVDEHFSLSLKGDDLRKCISFGDLLQLIRNAMDD